jgi:hypothetical protein
VVSFALERTEICWRRVLPGTDGSTVTGVGRKYMRGCSGRRLAPLERTGSRERGDVDSTAGRIPDVLPSLLGYAEMTGSCASADAAPEADSVVCGSLEVFAPPSGLPKILVRSPNVEFPYLKSLPRDRLSRCLSRLALEYHGSNIKAGVSRSGVGPSVSCPLELAA